MGEESSKEIKAAIINPIPKLEKRKLINLTTETIVKHTNKSPFDDYIKLNFLGEGAFSSVYRVQNKITGEIRAIKIIPKPSNYYISNETNILNEIKILKRIDHPNIIKIFEVYVDKNNFYMITELCPYGELFNEIINNGPFDENYASYVIYQILSGINYCHKMNIIHKELGAENILIVKKEKNEYPWVKICDFGTSTIFDKKEFEQNIDSSTYYRAPEVLLKNYNEKCDLWSCGVLLYFLLSGKSPFNGENEEKLHECILKGVYDLKSYPFPNLSKEALNLLKALLTLDPSKRISAEEAIKHPWLINNNAKKKFNHIKSSLIITRYIENLKHYKTDSIIQETALAYLVHNYPQSEDVINACKLFNQIDTNGDGKINKSELFKGLKDRIQSPSLEEDVEIIFRNIDGDNNGFIEYEEFIRAAVDKNKFLNNNILRYAFNYFDKNNKGIISYEDIKDVYKESITDKSKIKQGIEKIIKEADLNGDRIIDFEEFSRIMRRYD